MKIKELEKYNILTEMCSLILNNTDNEDLINFYAYYFEQKLKWLDENKSKIVSDFKKLYFRGNFDFAFRYWDIKYRHIYNDIIDEGVEWFNEE